MSALQTEDATCGAEKDMGLYSAGEASYLIYFGLQLAE
jgi:hypothetical protein